MNEKKNGIVTGAWKNRSLILKLARNDFRMRYAGSYLGIIWAFVQPVVTVLVYFLVFGIGFKTSTTTSVPFIVYLTCGIVPWFYCQDVLVAGTNTLIEYSYLVKKVVFNIDILPYIKAIAGMFVHLFFTLIAVITAALYGLYPTVYLIQILYYFVCMFIFLLGLVWGTCAVVVFFRDLTQIIVIALQIGIWSVPIMFDPANLSFADKWKIIFKINPMYYIINGYRDAIFARHWFWEHPWETLYFWTVTLIILAVGRAVFRKLKVHFADVL